MSNIKLITASALFDGHDVSINIFRKLMLKRGAEVIHLGHNRSVREVIQAAVQEDADAVLVSSYQGGHIEYFKYLVDKFKELESENILIFGGGGGVILPKEVKELEEYGVNKIYHATEGQKIGIDGIADDVIDRIKRNKKDSVETKEIDFSEIDLNEQKNISKCLSYLEESWLDKNKYNDIKQILQQRVKDESFVIGITGPGGAGKSSLIDELVNRFIKVSADIKIGILTVDPTKRFTGGALLGDRIRFNNIYNERVFQRSLATRESNTEISLILKEAIFLLKAAGYNHIIVETSGIGQGDSRIYDFVDKSIYVMTVEYGASTQLDKIDMLEVADHIVINKFEKSGSEDAMREVLLNYIRNNNITVPGNTRLLDLELPVYAVSSNQFNNTGLNRLFKDLLKHDTAKHYEIDEQILDLLSTSNNREFGLIDNKRTHYLSQISDTVYEYKSKLEEEANLAGECQSLKKSIELVDDQKIKSELKTKFDEHYKKLNQQTKSFIENWNETKQEYERDILKYKIHKNEVEISLYNKTLSGTMLPKVSLPKYSGWEELVRFCYKENLPGRFPFTAGVFPFKRTNEAPKRQFAGEGSAKRTNKRFHYLTNEEEAKRLSVAFDGITLYGEDPDEEPDIYGKIGESGVSISTIDDMERLLDGFDQTDPFTSVSMTINAPAPTILAMYFMVAFRKELAKKGEITVQEKEKLKLETFRKLRGTVQADMLKEDQAQNTCIFSIDFAMKLIGDVQEFLTENQIRNYYSLSISGYHIAEAGANPITQVAFTLANGFTYVEYFLKRGMKIDDFAPNLSFFFSNGLDPEYSVIGRVARRIWAVSMRDLYGANERSQKLKYHIQTSGRSLHAQEISFNDIRTTLQALTAYYDNCNSLHTNSYDEAITTPTEESVRRSMAIQMIINEEMGLTKNENPLQGSFIIEELTDLVEESILNEFYKISHRGGVTGAMEKQYQRSKIQEESLYYEEKKQSGELPIIGVNKFINPEAENPYDQMTLTRCPKEEKEEILGNLGKFKTDNSEKSKEALRRLKETALKDENIFAELLNTVQYASLGEITNVLYEVGGKYRRGI